VRGICCLRPGIAGVSENIRVRSIVGRFLEHARVFCFGNDGEAEVFCSSADWMERNFFRRVEVAFPILDPALRASLVEDLQLYLDDDRQAWQLGSDGVYARVEPRGEGGLSAQQALMDRYAAGALTP
jgi:polyphosphate kinase